MLDTVIPVTWTDGSCPAASGPFPAILSACAEHAVADGVRRLGPSPIGTGLSFPLRVGWLYAMDTGVVVLPDSRAHWCAGSSRLFLHPEEEAELGDRLAAMPGGTLHPLPEQWCGIGEALPDRPCGPGLGDRPPLYCPEAKALVFGTALPPIPPTGPAMAAVFHDIALPTGITLKIEPTTRCNFSCPFCYGRHTDQGDLSPAGFLAALEALPGLRAVELTGEGEPLLHPHLCEYLAECQRRGLKTNIATNGSLLTEARIIGLIEAGLDTVAVSLESLNPDRFSRYRPGGRLDRVIDGLRRLVRIRDERDAPMKIQLWTTILRDTIDEIPDFRRFARALGIDCVQAFQVLNPMPAYTRFYDESLARSALGSEDLAAMIADPATDPLIRATLEEASWSYRQCGCGIFMHTVMVNWRLEVTPCCLLKTPDFPSLGTLGRDGLREIWDQPRYQRFRFSLLHGIVPKWCEGCPDVAAA